MPRLPSIIPVTDLRQGSAEILKQVHDSKEPVVITQRGRAAAVLMSVELYEEREKERELLRLLARGEKEIQAGETVDFDQVIREVDALLAQDDR